MERGVPRGEAELQDDDSEHERIDFTRDDVREKRLDPGKWEAHCHGEEESHLGDSITERST